MNAGLLWFDDDSERCLEEKVRRAAARYERKYDRAPNLCFVHPDAFDGHAPPLHAGAVEIRPRRSTLPGHFWIGVDDENAGGNGKARRRGLIARVKAEGREMTPERARQLGWGWGTER